MNQSYIFEPIPCDKFNLLTREELEIFAREEQKIRIAFQKENEELKKQKDLAEQKTLLIGDQYVILKKKMFGKSSEKSPRLEPEINETKEAKDKKRKIQLPSLRYPNAPLIEKDIELKELPLCSCCGHKMEDSGMTEDSEYLTAIPRQFYVVRQKRHKYRCGSCHGDLKTAPGLPKIKAGSSYSDEMVIDVAMSKYCDLIPIERYSAMAGRSGIQDLPPNSLIQSTHNLADFVLGAYDKLKLEITSSKVLHADETTHRMLEGDKNPNWYFWGFSTLEASYFEAHDTRSGSVASRILKDAKCEFLISDVFSGYNKAVKDTNFYRREKNLPLVRNAYCNAHVRRKFNDALENFADEAKFFIEKYQNIYTLETSTENKPPNEKLKIRAEMRPHFEEMKSKALELLHSYPNKSAILMATNYFLRNYDEFVLFLTNAEIAIDNNPQERLMRNPVIGRKTWYGTHSRRGAVTASVIFSLVESCKLNKINPRIYFKDLVEKIHQGHAAFTPAEFAKIAEKDVPG